MTKFYLDRCRTLFIHQTKLLNVLLLPILSTLLYITSSSTAIAKYQLTQTTNHLGSMATEGNQISLNGRTVAGSWLRSAHGSDLNTYLGDAAFRQLFGVDFLSTSNWDKQPVQWYSSSIEPQVLATLLTKNNRYLNITKFAKLAGWQLSVTNNTLFIITPSVKVTDIQEEQTTNNRITVNLDYPSPWKITDYLVAKKTPNSSPFPDLTLSDSALPVAEWTITLDGVADPTLIQRYTPSPPALPLVPTLPTPQPLIKQVEVINNQTIIHLSVPLGLAPLISTLPNPNRLIIDIRPDALPQRSIAWAPGLVWQQQYVTVGTSRFAVVSLEVNPHNTIIRPILTNPKTLIGTAPLIKTAQLSLAVAAINGGYFNRNNRFPLGAIRLNGKWLSSPILNRGAIAWNDAGQFYFNRLTWQETLITPNSQQFPISFLNSGYVESGISRYTSAWGANYTPQTDNEIILVVRGNQVISQLPGGLLSTGQLPGAKVQLIPIPFDGYLLVLRGNAVNNANLLTVGTALQIVTNTFPADFNKYPQILAAGPLLLQKGQIALDGKSEQFTQFFVNHEAVRSGICTTTTGKLIIAAVGGRAGGDGPNLTEHAQVMQALGCVDALNLDGGSSTSLYLGGELLNRPASTAAAVNNGIGIFLQRP